MGTWIITRPGPKGLRFRDERRHLTYDLPAARRYETADAALAHADEGDTIQHDYSINPARVVGCEEKD